MKLSEYIEIEIITEKDFEKCVVCNKLTNIRKETEIEDRDFYIEGAGQLCKKCFYDLYQKNLEKK